MAHTIAQHMFRRVLSPQEAAQLYSAFEADRQMGLWMDIAML